MSITNGIPLNANGNPIRRRVSGQALTLQCAIVRKIEATPDMPANELASLTRAFCDLEVVKKRDRDAIKDKRRARALQHREASAAEQKNTADTQEPHAI